MAEHMRGYILEFRLSANAVEDADHSNEMPIFPVLTENSIRAGVRGEIS
jgi:hypothetical protein